MNDVYRDLNPSKTKLALTSRESVCDNESDSDADLPPFEANRPSVEHDPCGATEDNDESGGILESSRLHHMISRAIVTPFKDLTALVDMDPKAQRVQWRNGYTTFLPFLPYKGTNLRSSVSFQSKTQSPVALIRMQEQALVESMAKLPLVHHPGLVKSRKSPLGFADSLSGPLSCGNCVLVRPVIHLPIGWDQYDFRDILNLHGSAIVHAQS